MGTIPFVAGAHAPARVETLEARLAMAADCNGDYSVDVFDVAEISNHWGAAGGPSDFADSILHEVRVYSAGLTPPERDAVELSLMAKWGIA